MAGNGNLRGDPFHFELVGWLGCYSGSTGRREVLAFGEVFQAFQLITFADGDQAVTRPDDGIGGRIQSHHAVAALQGRNDNSLLTPDQGVRQRFSRNGGVLRYRHFFNFHVQARAAEGGIDEIENVGTQEEVSDAVSDEVVGRDDLGCSGALKLRGGFLPARPGDDFQVGAHSSSGEHTIIVKESTSLALDFVALRGGSQTVTPAYHPFYHGVPLLPVVRPPDPAPEDDFPP